MVKTLLYGAIACGIAAPTLAGERNATVPASWVLPTLNLPAGHSSALGNALMIVGDFTVVLHDAQAPIVTLTAFEQRMPQLDLVPDSAADPEVIVSPYAATDLRSLAAWRLTDRIAPTTANASGFYAVRDTLGEARKPRVFRPRALSATLMLRIDGKDETPMLGIGGGGVAAALWHAGRRQ